jgi:DUF971 family protein
MTPVEVRRIDQGRALSILWDDADVTTLVAAVLRAGSRAADSVRAIVDSKLLTGNDDVTIVGVEAVGNYALRLSFSDGHDRGIYPWSYLRDLGARTSRGHGNG